MLKSLFIAAAILGLATRGTAAQQADDSEPIARQKYIPEKKTPDNDPALREYEKSKEPYPYEKSSIVSEFDNRWDCTLTADASVRDSVGFEYEPPDSTYAEGGTVSVGRSSGYVKMRLGCRKKSWVAWDPALEFGFERSSFPMLGLTRYWSEKLSTRQFRLNGIQEWRVERDDWLSFPTSLGIAINGDPSTHTVEPIIGLGMRVDKKGGGLLVRTESFGSRALMVEGSGHWVIFDPLDIKAYYQHWLGYQYQLQTVFHEYGAKGTYCERYNQTTYCVYLTLSQTKFNATAIVAGVQMKTSW